MNSYYAQWDHSELMSMHGIEEVREADLCHEVDTDLISREPSYLSMDSLGLSWKDFM
jgi:hypothetical protein